MDIDTRLIGDHSLNKDDVKEISQSKLKAMDRIQRFEYRFPFYRMDVNGYQMHIKQAMKLFQPNLATFDIKVFDLECLQKAFSAYSSWSDLDNLTSDFVLFLKETC